MQERRARELCESCGKFHAKYIVDIRAAVTVLGKLLCARCMKKVLSKHPDSQAVNLPQYEEQWKESPRE